ncbi:MAG: alginate O-acetyltransferase AlgX-related protein [Planctomycetota bacterium]
MLAFACLVTTWVLSPGSPSRTFRNLAIGSVAAWILVLTVPRLRQSVGGGFRRWSKPINLVVINAIATIVLAEVVLHVLAMSVSSPIFAPISGTERTVSFWRGRPHDPFMDTRLNALGFLDEEFEVARKPGVRRVVALADSFGVGVVPYRENFLTLLDHKLDDTSETEVMNFSVMAINPSEYLHLYNSEAASYAPDLVLVCFFVGNDFGIRKEKSVLHADSLMSVTVVKRILKASLGVEVQAAADLDQDRSFTEAAFLRIEAKRMQMCNAASRRAQRRFAETFEVLTEMHETIGDRLRIVIIPDEYQVNDELWRKLTLESSVAFDRELPQRKLAGFFRKRGVKFLDLLPPLRAAESKAPTYKLRDTHWNGHGNRIAAEAIARWLQ